MARAIWSGSIGFGMVSIPVKLFGATESEDFEKLPLPSKHAIELSAFVKQEEIDPVFKVIDLADALRRSVEAAKKSKPKRAARPRTRPAARRATRKVS